MSTSWTALHVSYGFYILSETDSISVLPVRDYAWTEQQFMQLVSTFVEVYLKDVAAPLESICYSGPHAWYIKANEIKQARQKARQKGRKKKQNKTIRTNTDTVCKGSIQQIIK